MEEFSDGGSTPPASTRKKNHTEGVVLFSGYRKKLNCSGEMNTPGAILRCTPNLRRTRGAAQKGRELCLTIACAKVLSRWLKTLVRRKSAAPLCGGRDSAAQRAAPPCLFLPQTTKC